ncbi:MAG: GtrA family protein [Paludibacteraceae bacterium]|jgi:putative flippase GtrA|nr:GtrA family protein [Paludibacteraceae bacterium]
MKLPTRYLPRVVRTAVRFAVLGISGTLVQTWFFMAALFALDDPEKGAVLYYVAFTIGYIMEMIPNYLLSNWYTFGTRPNWKNASGFVIARVVNFPLQLALLPLFIRLLPTWRDDYISFLVIFIAGCVNYFICLLFFKKKKE